MTAETTEVKVSRFSKFKSWVMSRIFEKKFLLPFALGLGFLIFKGLIKVAIKNWLLLPYDAISNSYFIDAGVIIAFIFSIFYSWSKYKINYRPSYNYYLITVVLTAMYTCFRFSPVDWLYVDFKFTDKKIYYLDAAALAFLILPFLNFLKYIKNLFRKKGDEPKNYLIEDSPINKSSLDELGYTRLAKEISSYVIADNYKSSFSFGLVGPWGNGKSSIFNLIKENISIEADKDIIQIDFSPYLNHDSSDIISDFFTSFSNKIKKFDGSLENNISDYSSYLIKAYKTKNFSSLFDFKINGNDESANELYTKINNALQNINKKVVVYIDDLDRLNSEEILGTLKLIRNTANFHNSIFIVALDKQYVISTLKIKDKSKHTKFIDKFFQLEIYLPQIPKEKLKESFVNLIKASRIDNDLQLKLIESISDNTNLFELFIHNFRDLKKLINQLIFEHEFVLKDIDATDYMNFIYLKSNFPGIIQMLNERRESILERIENRLTLRTEEKNQDNNDFVDLIHLGTTVFSPQLDFYKFTKSLTSEKSNLKDELNLDGESIYKLSSLLIALFGERAQNNMLNAVQVERNFYRLMRMSYAIDDFTEEEFAKILNASDDKTLHSLLDEVFSSKKANQLLTRVEYHNMTSQEEITVAAKALFYMTKQEDVFDLNLVTIYDQLAQILNISEKQNVKIDNQDTFISKVFFEDKTQKAQTKLELIFYLIRNKDTNGLWGYEIKTLEVKAVKYFEKYLDEYRNDFWELSDLSAYYFYDKLLEFTKNKQVKTIFLDFLASCRIDKFCSQMLVNEPFTFLKYSLSDRVKFIFGSNVNFIKFLETHKNKNKGVDEFLRYLKILQLGNFIGSRKFIFQHLPGRDFLGNNRLSERDKKEAENLVQIHIKLATELDEFDMTFSSTVFDKNLNNISHDKTLPDGSKVKYLLIGSIDYEPRDLFNKFFTEMHRQLEMEHFKKFDLDIDFKSRTATIINEGLVLVELVEIQYGKAPDGWKYSND
jgi:hypothetical protein